MSATIVSVLAVVVGLIALVSLVGEWPKPFGLAAWVTTFRLALVLGLGVAAIVHPEPSAWIIVIAVIELVLDGVDGPIARRRGEASAAGARLDGETDALFVLILSLLCFRRPDGPGVVVLAIGSLRHVIWLSGWWWPRLRGQVPSSLRAKIICDSAIVALLLCLLPGPNVPAWARTGLCAAILAALIYSFSFDVRYLLARSRT